MQEIIQRIGHVSANLDDRRIVIWGGYSKDNDDDPFDESIYYPPNECVIFDGVLGFPKKVITEGIFKSGHHFDVFIYFRRYEKN